MKNNKGFSLIEISIVVIIIGLLITAISAGSAAIRSAQISKLISTMQGVKSAGLTFKKIYNYYPGDYPNAQAIWGEDACPDLNPVLSSWRLRCSGNGDSFIGDYQGHSAPHDNSEHINYYSHLQLANIPIAGQDFTIDTSTCSGTNCIYINSNNTLTFKLESELIYLSLKSASDNNLTPPGLDTLLSIGKANNAHITRGVSRETSYIIDNKIDDGELDQGFLFAAYNSSVAGFVFHPDDDDSLNQFNPRTEVNACTDSRSECALFWYIFGKKNN